MGVPANQRKGLIGEDSDWSHFLLHLLLSVPVLGQLPESVAGTTSPLKGSAKTEARESDPEKKMREIVHLQAGQCGNQIGAKVGSSKENPAKVNGNLGVTATCDESSFRK